MDYYVLLCTIVAAAIGSFIVFRKFRFHQETEEIDSFSSSSSVASSSLTPLSSDDPSLLYQNWTHQVFPSFRGEDVRIGFLSHIQKEFKRKGITPFIDNEIKRGESIAPELIQAIRGSKIAIILISKNYASSKWCLNELVEIMSCRKELGQTVMVIFYKVDPCDVKKLVGDFGKVFKKTCEDQSKEDIRRWKEALAEVATIAGYHSINWNNEAEMIEQIATDVSNALMNNAPSNDFNSLIGMRGHMEKVGPFLQLDSDEVRVIGIWGPSGIGKTTLSRFIYSKYADQFQLSVFMENIKRRYPKPYYDEYSAKLQLQTEFFSGIISQRNVKINHLGVAQDRLKDKRVLVVLDDVDHLLQLEAMAKETLWFGRGSWIIITTQDRRILNAYGVNHIYEVGFPCDEEALQIFCMNAFVQSFPYEGFEDLAWEATKLSGKLPLGLKVMGSHFKGMDKHEWKMELPRLRTNLDGEIESILKFSYDALFEEDKCLFLYIACFFNKMSIEKVEVLLETKFPNVRRGLQVLAEKSLISLKWDRIEMHDLLTRLGREIVRKQSIHDLEKRQFLHDARDICQILSNDTVANRSIIGMDSKDYEIEDQLHQTDIIFDRMFALEFLRIRSNFRESRSYFLHLPRKVKVLEWGYFPMKILPLNFNPEFLVELNMYYSKLEKLWEGIKMIPNLKWISLYESKYLKELADISSATNLTELGLQGCSSLVELPSSIGNAINLVRLYLRDCSSLVELSSSIGNATNLKKLYLEGCSNLVELPSSIGNAINLEILDLGGCSSMVELPTSIGNAINLKRLNLRGCSRLVKLPTSIGNAINLEILNLSDCSSLVELPTSIGNAINLEILDLGGCSSLVELPSSIGNAINLEKLNLTKCSRLVELPFSIGNATNLKILNLTWCTNLVELPTSIGNAINLEILDLSDCSSLVELPTYIGNAINLEILDLSDCSSLVELPTSIGNAINLEILDLRGCSSLVELPSSIGNAINLEKLNLTKCLGLVELPSSIGNAINLEMLNLKWCKNLVELPLSIGNAINLKKLYLEGCSSLVKLPSSIGNAINLEMLNLKWCKNLVELPSSIGNAINLEILDLGSCSSLVELPTSIGNAINLKKLDLGGCSSLVELPTSIGNAINLERLYLNYCSSLVELPTSIGNAINLERLYLSYCSSLIELPPSIGNAINLEILNLGGCSSLVELTTSIGNAINLKDLNLRNCSSLMELPTSIGNAINLKKLNLGGCSSLVELPTFTENAINLERLYLSDCSSLVELPPFIGNAINLERLYLRGCSSLVELPSSIGDAINLKILDLEGCFSLVELPTSIGNAINLKDLYLECCSRLVELPSSIGHLDNLRGLYLGRCSKLRTFPTNINMKSLDNLDLSDCSLLKQFPEISTNIRVLKLNGTAVKEIPSSIRLWARLDELSMSYSEDLKEFPHIFDFITELHLSNTRIQEIAPWIKRMSRLSKLVMKGCTKLVSLPKLPKSVAIIDAENCFKLNQEARDLIINSTCGKAVLPGDKVPTNFTYRAIGSSLSVTVNGIDIHSHKFIRFKACFLLVNKSAVEVDTHSHKFIRFDLPLFTQTKRNDIIVLGISKGILGRYLNEHLYIFDVKETITTSELVFKFEVDDDDENWEIGECGLSTPTLVVDES